MPGGRLDAAFPDVARTGIMCEGYGLDPARADGAELAAPAERIRNTRS